MQITRENVANAVVVRIDGWLDATTAKDLERELLAVIGPQSSRIVLDFRSVAYVSSAGLRIVLAAAKQIRALHGAFAIFGAEQAVQRVFEISGFARIIPMVASEAEAVALVQR